MGWSFGKKQSYELLSSSILISIFIFILSYVFIDTIWVSIVIAVLGFVVLSLGIFPFYLPKMISYINVNLNGVEYYHLNNWQDRLQLIFDPDAFKLSKINYSDIDDISVITGKKVLDPEIGARSTSGVLITTKDNDDIFVDISWYDTVDNPVFDRAMEFVQDCAN